VRPDGMGQIVAILAASDLLRHGLSTERAADVMLKGGVSCQSVSNGFVPRTVLMLRCPR
jgi:hypothetical protein